MVLSWSVVDRSTGAGPDFIMSLPLERQAGPAVVYNPDDDQYLVVRQDGRSGASYKIYSRTEEPRFPVYLPLVVRHY